MDLKTTTPQPFDRHETIEDILQLLEESQFPNNLINHPNCSTNMALLHSKINDNLFTLSNNFSFQNKTNDLLSILEDRFQCKDSNLSTTYFSNVMNISIQQTSPQHYFRHFGWIARNFGYAHLVFSFSLKNLLTHLQSTCRCTDSPHKIQNSNDSNFKSYV